MEKSKSHIRNSSKLKGTSIKLPEYQVETIQACDLVASAIVRDLLEEYLLIHHPIELEKQRKKSYLDNLPK